ncbi:MAG: sodium:proline symporter [Bacteroidetes bacterium QS_1_63_11]|nr:MAG: sodium:proline symporter [Bacteroidetes bacterium QS_1_63_11]
MTLLDWFFVVAYLVLSFGVALYFYQRAGEDTSEFFLSGRAMPWWLAGTSMVATTFAVDTPLLVTEIVAEDGIAGNWLWWNAAIGGMLTVFFFARLWRRSGVMTDVEFVEFRYSGRVAAWLRGLKAVFFGLLLNILIIGWVSLAMETVIDRLFPNLTLFGQEAFSMAGKELSAALIVVGGMAGKELSAALIVVGGLILVVSVYALLSGLWGVMVTDLFQFVVAMGGTIALAFLVLDMPEIGGVAGLREQLPDETFHLLPTIGGAAEGAATFSLSALAFAAYAGVQWWASWYPGAEPGGGGYIAQRMMSAKDEPNALFATLWYTIAHFCLRPWPWIIVALAALVLYPGLDEPRAGFVLVMKDVLPPGMLGLLFAAFLAAFMSTVSTQLNWGVSYLVNDFWARFVRPEADEDHYVFVSRTLTFVVALLSLVVTLFLDTIAEAWGLLLSASAGLGLVLILRWYWWRVNAWSEMVATVAPIALTVVALVLNAFGIEVPGLQAEFPVNLYSVVGFTTIVWLAATFLTRPTDEETLDAFYRKVHPGGHGLVGVVLVYSTLFGTGYLILGWTGWGLVCIAVSLSAAVYLWRDLQRDEVSLIEMKEEKGKG